MTEAIGRLVDVAFIGFMTLLNGGILALNIKLYTEIMKEKSQNRRAEEVIG
jgi:hypothetical protein